MFILIILTSIANSEYVEFEVTSRITWGWEFLENDIIRFTLKCQADGYCGIGLGNNKMYPTDMFVITRNGSKAEVEDYWAASHAAPTLDIDREGGQQDYILVSSSFQDDLLTASFDRKLNTGDKWDWDIVEGEKIDYVYALHGSDTAVREFHNKFGNGEVTIARQQEESSIESQPVDNEAEFDTHGMQMTVMWFVVAHVGIIVARYFKQWYWWYWIHVTGFSVCTAWTFYSVFYIYSEKEASNLNFEDKEKTYTSRIGFAIVQLVFGQSLMGIIIRFNVWCNKTNVHIIGTMRAGHKLLGWTLAVLTSVQMYFGWERFDHNYDENKLELLYFAFMILAALYTVLEIHYQFSSHVLNHPIMECRRSNLPWMTYTHTMDLIKQGRKLVFYDEMILDIGDYMWSHPGGAVMFEKSIGQDVGKYLNGCSSIGGKFNPYLHSAHAFKLARQLAIAQLPGNVDNSAKIFDKTDVTLESPSVILTSPSQILHTDEDRSNIIVERNPADEFMLVDGNWRFVDKKLIANNTYDFTFVSEDVYIPNTFSCVSAMGQHFAVSYLGVTRYYSYSLALTPDHQKALNTMQKGIQQLFDARQDYLHLYIKWYSKGSLTEYLMDIPEGTRLCMKGPMGPGLHLTPNTSGRCIAIGGGTGVIPFLDLVELLYWKKVDPYQSPDILNDLQLTMYVSFTSKEDFVGEELLTATAQIYRDDDTFELYDRLDPKVGRINQDLVNRLVPEDSTFVWVCGPSVFNGAVRELLDNTNVSQEAIVIL